MTRLLPVVVVVALCVSLVASLVASLGVDAENHALPLDNSASATTHSTTILRHVHDGSCELLQPLAILAQAHRLINVSSNAPVIVERSPAVRKERGRGHDHRGRREHNMKEHSMKEHSMHMNDSSMHMNDEVVRIYARTAEAVQRALVRECPAGIRDMLEGDNDNDDSDADVEPILVTGPPSNRIDVVIMGDGYTAIERERFINDTRRLVADMWSATTYTVTLPLFNIWAVFRASRESGIGRGGKAKDTAFRLYRDGTELRAIFPGNANAARSICRKLAHTGACDYPSLIANDDYYGGLGGEFAISTRSLLSGTIVLRHEFGHNFVAVGEEYDGGQVYSGVNSGRSVSALPWAHWLDDKVAREEKNALALQAYPWHDLEKKGRWSSTFTSDGTYARWMAKFSVSGIPEQNGLRVLIDGVEQPWTSTGVLDRTFYEVRSDVPLTSGRHTLAFELRDGLPALNNSMVVRQLCNVVLHEFMPDAQYSFNTTRISAYPTYSIHGSKTYRPTNEQCLMRNMTSTSLCPVCREGLWREFLKRVDLIDNVTATCEGEGDVVRLTLATLPLGKWRTVGQAPPGEALSIEWMNEGRVVSEFSNTATVLLDRSRPKHGWTVRVRLVSSEIRKIDARLVVSERKVVVPECFARTAFVMQV